MTSGKSLKWKLFWHKVTHWEYWPFSVLYFPVNFYFIWLMVRCRSFFFFTASNPTVDFGGMLGEEKSKIYDFIPDRYLPTYKLIKKGDLQSALNAASRMGYPIICKPNIGERGKLVEKIECEDRLKDYIQNCPVDFLVQELVDYPIELGVFYVRQPDEEKGKVTSIVKKEFLHVVGDGKRSVKEILHNSNRAVLQLDFDHDRFQKLLKSVPKKGEKVIVESIGNHCRGTTFFDAHYQIDEKINDAFNRLAGEINGFYFGRFDLRCQSFDDLRKLYNFKILELNGAGAEPAHIYEPGASLWKGYRDIFWHLNQLAQISQKNHRMGVPYWSTLAGIRKMLAIRKYNQKIKDYL